MTKRKKEILEMIKDADPHDMKEVFAELTEQFLELDGNVDILIDGIEVFTKDIRELVRTLSYSLYFYSISNIALTESLIEAGIVSREELKQKIADCPEKEKLSEYLGLKFLAYPGIDSTDIGRLEKWLDPKTKDQVMKVH